VAQSVDPNPSGEQPVVVKTPTSTEKKNKSNAQRRADAV
jgi:hypothetical protein